MNIVGSKGFYTGHIVDPADVVLRRPGLHILAARHGGLRGAMGGALPPSTNNRGAMTFPVLDQGQTGSCVGHAFAAGATLRLAIAGSPVSLRSPIAIYLLARKLGGMGALQPDGSRSSITDDGSEPSLAAQGLREWGVPAADEWGNYPADPSTINADATEAELERSSLCELDGAYFLQSVGDQFLRDLMASLAAGFPVACAVPGGGPEFQGYSGGILGSVSGPIDHDILAVDYSWDGSDLGTLVVNFLNSWGLWGEGGFVRAGRTFLGQMADCGVLDVRRV